MCNKDYLSEQEVVYYRELINVSKSLNWIKEDYESWFWDDSLEKNGKYARRMKAKALTAEKFGRIQNERVSEIEAQNDELLEITNRLEKEANLRKKDPSLQAAWDNYQVVLNMVE